jgi:osmotically-inducible protein OsmY
MRVLLALIIGIIVGAAVIWYYNTNRGNPDLRSAANRIENTAQSARDTLEEKLRSLHLGTNDIRDELARTGRIVREKARAAGQAIVDATADARITAAVKARLLASRDVSSLSISVSTSNGIVTVSGTVPKAEDIGKVMVIALETEGVRQVISTIQVQGKAGQVFRVPGEARIASRAPVACESGVALALL